MFQTSMISEYSTLLNQDVDVSETIFVPFPGYVNIDINGGVVINPSNNDGTPDVLVPKTDSYSQTPSLNLFREYKFTIDEQVAFEIIQDQDHRNINQHGYCSTNQKP